MKCYIKLIYYLACCFLSVNMFEIIWIWTCETNTRKKWIHPDNQLNPHRKCRVRTLNLLGVDFRCNLWKRLVMKKMCLFRRFVVLCLKGLGWFGPLLVLVDVGWWWLMLVLVDMKCFFQCIILFVSVACYFVANGCYWLMSCILWNPSILPKDLWEIPQQVKHIVRWHAVTLWIHVCFWHQHH